MSRNQHGFENVKESRGGGIYVENGGVFTLKSGKISGNQAFMEPGRGIFAADVDSYAKGGGVYVEAGGVFNMFGGEVSKNATRSFFKNWSTGTDRIYHAYSEGGGICSRRLSGRDCKRCYRNCPTARSSI